MVTFVSSKFESSLGCLPLVSCSNSRYIPLRYFRKLLVLYTFCGFYTISYKMGYLEFLPLILRDICYLCSWLYFTKYYCLRPFHVFTCEFWMYITKNFILNAHNGRFYSFLFDIFSIDNDVIPLARLTVSYCSLLTPSIFSYFHTYCCIYWLHLNLLALQLNVYYFIYKSLYFTYDSHDLAFLGPFRYGKVFFCHLYDIG